MPLRPAVPFDPDLLAATLQDQGVCLLSGYPDPITTNALRDHELGLVSTHALKSAQVGHGQNRVLRGGIRGDSTRWLDDDRGLSAMAYLTMLDDLRRVLNQRLYLGLEEVEAHFAAYPIGAFYERHRDRFHDSDARVISVVTYLNRDWLPEHGGALRIHLPDEIVDVLPEDGITVCFLSELEHEVLPAARQRLSIAGWMRKRGR